MIGRGLGCQREREREKGEIVTDKRVNYEWNGWDFSFNPFRRISEGNNLRDEIVGVRFEIRRGERGEGWFYTRKRDLWLAISRLNIWTVFRSIYVDLLDKIEFNKRVKLEIRTYFKIIANKLWYYKNLKLGTIYLISRLSSNFLNTRYDTCSKQSSKERWSRCATASEKLKSWF